MPTARVATMIPHFPRTQRQADGRMSRGGWRRSFRSVLTYLFDARAHAGEDVRLAHGNMAGRTPKDLAREFALSRSLRPDVERPVWHVALSPAPEDREAWADPERRTAIVEAFVRRTITKEWEARREKSSGEGALDPRPAQSRRVPVVRHRAQQAGRARSSAARPHRALAHWAG